VNDSSPKYSKEPVDNKAFTENFDRFYSRFARTYDLLVKYMPVWRKWINHAVSQIQGTCVLEVSFGTGYLLTQYADRYQVYGIDYNAAMAKTAKTNLSHKGLNAELQQADVNFLPFKENSFDTIINTMAFSGYADGKKVLAELGRVLKPDGKLVMIDINHPKDHNWLGTSLVRFWMASGDIIRDIDDLFNTSGWSFNDDEIGGFGSVHLYTAQFNG